MNVIHADLNDIIFDDRNKAYGAYHIRKEYSKTVWQAFGLAASSFLGLTLLFFFLGRTAPAAVEELSQMIDASEVNLQPKLPETPKTIPVVPDEPKEEAKPAEKMKGMDTQKFDLVKPVATADPNATMAADSSFKDKQPGLATTDSLGNGALGGDPNGKKGGDPAIKDIGNGTGNANKNDIPDPFTPFMGESPKPMNLDVIRKAIGYPADARDMKMEGKVDFRILVDEQGHYMRHITLKRSHPIFEDACVRQLKNLQFEPGKMGDKPVKVWVVIPFKFTLAR